MSNTEDDPMSWEPSESQDEQSDTEASTSAGTEIPDRNNDTSKTDHSGADITEVREVICENLGDRVWKPLEAVLATHGALLISGVDGCSGVILVGPSGCGKTTTLRLIEDANGTYRSDDVTPKAFVSHDSSYTDEELEDIDLLPRIKDRTLMIPDMANWFAGNQERLRERMSTLAILMDGRGYTRDSGAQGERGYTGDYRFGLVGASTPLKPQAWEIMGHVGQRLLFYEMPEPESVDDAAEDVFGPQDSGDKIDHCQSVVVNFMDTLWDQYNGPRSVEWGVVENEEVREAIKYLARLVRYGRAPIEDDVAKREAPRRILNRLLDIARGRALLYGRQHLLMEDIEMCAQLALSTVPEKRREIIRATVNPEMDNELTASDIEPRVTGSRKTILKQMNQLQTLGMGEVLQEGGRSTRSLMLWDDFVWPDHLPFPER